MVIVSIAGDPGSGKSTLAKQLAARLGVPHYSMGDVFKRIAKEYGMTAVEFSKKAEEDPDVYDKIVDAYQENLAKEEDAFVIDSRLGFHFIPQSIKIYVRCSFPEAARRLMGDKREDEPWESVEAGSAALQKRQASEGKRYMSLYGANHTDLSNFDIVIDSTETSHEEKFALALEGLRKHNVDIPDE